MAIREDARLAVSASTPMSVHDPTTTESYRIAPAGDQALVIEVGVSISREINKRVRDLEEALVQSAWPEIVAIVPSYSSLLVYYDPVSISFEELSKRICILGRNNKAKSQRVKRWTLPVCYGGEYGYDLEELATKLAICPDEIVRTHSEVEYMVYLIGFSPGFAYLGELPSSLEVPRKTKVAPLIPPNTIQVGGQQTAISSMPMPSGWYIVGQTPVRMYEPAGPRPFLLNGGDLVRFERISQSQFIEISEQASRGQFELVCEWVQ